MSVEFVAAAHVQDLQQRLQAARQRAVDACGPPPATAGDRYWEELFEHNAAQILAEIPSVTLPAGHCVRYRFFGMRERDLLVRPFVARAATDVAMVRRILDWHAPPDTRSAEQAARAPLQDVDLLYRHFSFPRTAVGYFEYWLLLQELWASQRWAFAHLIASAAELSQLTADPGWEIVEPIQAYEPAVVLDADGARLAVLVQSPLERFTVHLEQIEIGADQSIRYASSALIASGPKGYLV